MQRLLLTFILCAPMLLVAQTSDSAKKILMVVSSYGKNQGEDRPGFEMDEFSQAYLIFKKNGLTIDVASPRGGKVVADQYNVDKPYNKALLADQSASDLLENTVPTSEISASQYDAIYIVGGKGAMFDLPFDPDLQDVIQQLYERDNTIISSVCHGPAVLANVKSDGKYIIEGEKITGFTNMEEQLFGKKWVKEFPFMLEDKLTERGAIFEQADFMLAQVSISGKFVTGQNPFSTPGSAEAVVKALGLEPVAREAYQDENTIYLIQSVLDGKTDAKAAAKQLKKSSEKFDIPLMAVYGYYKIMAAEKDETEIRKGLDLVEMTSSLYFNENLQIAVAQSYISMGNKKKAKEILEDLVKKELLVEQAEKMLKEIS